MSFIKNIRAVFKSQPNEINADSGALVENVIITAGFAIAALFFVNWVTTALINKAAETAECIEGSNVHTAGDSAKICKEAKSKYSDKNSFKKDETYKGRFG